LKSFFLYFYFVVVVVGGVVLFAERLVLVKRFLKNKMRENNS